MRRGAVLQIALAVVVGIAAGVGAYTFLYARGGSYLLDDPAACGNCHVMRGHLDAWAKDSHSKAASCNDCHTPPGLLAKYAVKASNGFRHSYAFTTGRFHEPIRIKPGNADVTEAACRKCHGAIASAIEAHADRPGERTNCIRCHATVGHEE
ncbi:MAG: cytochrome c nitrite reductase small subunit [Deltaproteobacteria bacterium]|nr:cytochrome c nitrite reductase small subunit [Deltaproteobacteria bacterium]